MQKKNIFKIITVSAMIFFAAGPSHAQSDMENTQLDSLSSQRKISLFNYSEITSIGLTVGYLTYKEKIDLTDDIQQFKDHFGNAPKISGAPKSTENGVVFGLCADKTFYSWQNRMLLRPKVSFLFGYDNTYDGSSQQHMVLDPKGDTIGFEYDPVQYKKNNFFLDAGCDIGYAFPNLKLPFALYSGVDFKVWYRDLLATQGQLYYSIGVNHSETYYWFNLPLGIIITKPMSPTLFLGMDARIEWMFYGSMKVSTNNGSGGDNYPAVTLGNRPSFKLELFSQSNTHDNESVKISPYVIWYGFEKSNTAAVTTSAQDQHMFLEPASRSFMVGINLSLLFLKRT